MSNTEIWAVVPAAGCGKRMGCETPKQYLPLAGRSMIDWTLKRLLQVGEIKKIVVAVAPEDQQFARLQWAEHRRVCRVAGGATRAQSVLAGLESLQHKAADDDVVLVHDAARPLVHVDDIRAVVNAVKDSTAQAAILAQPIADTVKREVGGFIDQTISRDHLWAAQTPQAARYGVLKAALQSALKGENSVTDEAGALEASGVGVKLVASQFPNFKLTTPLDMQLAEAVLNHQNPNPASEGL